MEEKLVRCFRNFQLTDILGFGKLLGVKETENFESYFKGILGGFSMLSRKEQKELLKLAKEISLSNLGK